jgi:hypothetical protein
MTTNLTPNTLQMLSACIVDPTTPEAARVPLMAIALRGSAPQMQFSCMQTALQGSASNPKMQFSLMEIAAIVAAEVAAEVSSQEEMPARAHTVGHPEAPTEGDELPRVQSA